ncbi:energy transducer TonB, partial [Curvivirga aplysinae]|uniref:energy transducer TonB n=1 Tax=Curvivirga aplysinae TaxID=2529852 RepID=UPI001C3F6B01
PEPEAEPVPEEVKKPEPKKPEPKPKTAPVVKQPRPSAKPQEPQQAKKPEKPKNDLASVLKTVQKLEDTPKPKPEPEEKKEDKKELALADILKNAQKPKASSQTPRRQVRDASELLSSSELDAVKRQIANCWSIQPGARNAEDLIVKLRVTMNPDRTVRTVEVIKGSGGNPFQGAAERSAQAAVYKCSPLRLPADKYDVWNIINFTFDPKQMFG